MGHAACCIMVYAVKIVKWLQEKTNPSFNPHLNKTKVSYNTLTNKLAKAIIFMCVQHALTDSTENIATTFGIYI